MSYILDALRRAEAERERARQPVPGLSSQRPAEAFESGEQNFPRWAIGVGVIALVAVAGAAGAWWAGQRHAQPSDATSPDGRSAVPPSAHPASGPAVASEASVPPLQSPAARTPQSAVAAVVVPPQKMAPVAPPPPPKVTAAPTMAGPSVQGALPAEGPSLTPPPPALQPGPQQSAGAAAVSARAAPTSLGAGATAAASNPGSARASLQGSNPARDSAHDGVILTPPPSTPTLADLSPALRREIPKMSISGSVYSDDAASRFAIINGEVLHEGAHITTDLVLEQIRTHELVLRFKGQRFRQPI